jgi:hypothetical protein
MTVKTDLANFDIVCGTDADTNCAQLWARDTARSFLMSQGFAPDESHWHACDVPEWSVLPFGSPEGFKGTNEKTGVVEFLRPQAFIRNLATKIAERCRVNNINLRIGFMPGDATIEPL